MNIKNPNTIPYEELEKFMNANGHTQSSIARLLGVSTVTISRWKEAGEIPAKRASAVRLIVSCCQGSNNITISNTGNNNNFFNSRRVSVIKKILADSGICADCKNKVIAYLMEE